jgi:hypothetical protein
MSYDLMNKENILLTGTFEATMQELMKIIKETGVPEVSYNDKLDATEFRFEGYFCNFSIYLKAKN